MTYALKELFYTLQGEGVNAGRAAVFARFSGCNLWSGREEDRSKGSGGCAMWCDTDFFGTNGGGGGRFATAADLAGRIAETWAAHSRDVERRFVVFTGGEPALQLDDALVCAVQAEGFQVAIETNGTLPVPEAIDWVCVSPKAGAPLVLDGGNELKFVYPQDGLAPSDFEHLAFEHWLVQPRDGLARVKHTAQAVEFCLRNPKWRLTLQAHKVVGLR